MVQKPYKADKSAIAGDSDKPRAFPDSNKPIMFTDKSKRKTTETN